MIKHQGFWRAFLVGQVFLLFVGLFGNAALAQDSEKATHNHFKAKLQSGEIAIGARSSISPEVTAIVADTGYDWLFIDLEHGAFNRETVNEMLLATKGTNAAPIVRIQGKESWLAQQVLDIGAMGIIFPNILSPEEASAAVQSAYYPPLGARSIGPRSAASLWEVPLFDYLDIANREIMVVVLIEHVSAVERISEIVTVPGIDLVMIGPNDLAASMGHIGQLTHPEVEAAIQTILSAGLSVGMPVGTIAADAAETNDRFAQGFSTILVGSDQAFLIDGAKATLDNIYRE